MLSEPPDISAAVTPAAEILLSELASSIATGVEPNASAAGLPIAKSNDGTEIPSSSGKTEDSSDETDMLLSLFSMMPEEDVPPPEEEVLSAKSAEKLSVSAMTDSASPEDGDPAGEDGDIREENTQQTATVPV
ncbi:TPA: hypothetical protein I8Y21_006407, partial [Klebsiella oxytoca]|nr:hypothetical protein [Klebsiella oxytoca]